MSDPAWELAAGELRALVSPFGASLRRMWRETPTSTRDLLWGYTGTADKKGGQGDVLMPWPGRIRDGRYDFAGAKHQLPCNDKDGPNAIHGFLRSRTWEGAKENAAMARFATRIDPTEHAGYPFSLEVVVGYDLLPTGLACAFVVRNAGKQEAPFGAGFHPYLAFPGNMEEIMLQVPAQQVLEYDGVLPTGLIKEVAGDLDFRTGRPLAGARLNHCFTGLQRDLDGFARIRCGDLELWMDAAFGHVVLYTGDALGQHARRGLAIEPMTCAPDAFNHPGWGTKVLQPGETWHGTWGITVERDAGQQTA